MKEKKHEVIRFRSELSWNLRFVECHNCPMSYFMYALVNKHIISSGNEARADTANNNGNKHVHCAHYTKTSGIYRRNICISQRKWLVRIKAIGNFSGEMPSEENEFMLCFCVSESKHRNHHLKNVITLAAYTTHIDIGFRFCHLDTIRSRRKGTKSEKKCFDMKHRGKNVRLFCT